MIRLACLALLAAGCRGADGETPTEWWGDHPDPDTFCGAHRDAVAASPGCDEGHADLAFEDCLGAYEGAYEERCIDPFAEMLPCLDAEAAYLCGADEVSPPDACEVEVEAYTDCATAFTTYSPT